jgi:hypothetical protein
MASESRRTTALELAIRLRTRAAVETLICVTSCGVNSGAWTLRADSETFFMVFVVVSPGSAFLVHGCRARCRLYAVHVYGSPNAGARQLVLRMADLRVRLADDNRRVCTFGFAGTDWTRY